jgi:hypothetical protein
MKTVRDACQLQPNALSIKLSDQIEQLDGLISAEAEVTACFDDAEREPGPKLLWDMEWQVVKKSVQGLVREVAG